MYKFKFRICMGYLYTSPWEIDFNACFMAYLLKVGLTTLRVQMLELIVIRHPFLGLHV